MLFRMTMWERREAVIWRGRFGMGIRVFLRLFLVGIRYFNRGPVRTQEGKMDEGRYLYCAYILKSDYIYDIVLDPDLL